METFSKIVSNFTQEFQDLVGIILDINWVTRSSDFAIVYSQFLENLVSAHAFYMFPVAERLINLLCWSKFKYYLRYLLLLNNRKTII